MMPAAKHFDPVIGVDIHIVQPPGPVPPIPVPHPFIGFLFDPFDYVPVFGATVYVNAMRRAIAGTAGKTVPGVHFPIGGAFVKPPGNECEMFMGSSTVDFDGDAASHMLLPALSCQDIGMVTPFRRKKKGKLKTLVLPTSVVLPIPLGPPVLIGGPPTISLMAMGMKLGMSALGKGLKRLMKTGLGKKLKSVVKKVSDKMHAAADNLLSKLGISKASKIRNAVHRSICKVTGHPVDVATGKVFTESIDFELHGPLSLRWERVWYSTSDYNGPLGHGWHHSYDLGLMANEDAVAVRLADGRGIAFPPVQPGQESSDEFEGLTLARDAEGYLLRDRQGFLYRFAPAGRGMEHSLVRIEDGAGTQIILHYDPRGRLIRIADSSGSAVSLGWNSENRIAEIRNTHPENPGETYAIVRYGYDEQGDLVVVYDALDQPFRYQYSNHLLVKETDRRGYAFHFRYDGTDTIARCVATTGEDGLYAVRLA